MSEAFCARNFSSLINKRFKLFTHLFVDLNFTLLNEQPQFIVRRRCLLILEHKICLNMKPHAFRRQTENAALSIRAATQYFYGDGRRSLTLIDRKPIISEAMAHEKAAC